MSTVMRWSVALRTKHMHAQYGYCVIFRTNTPVAHACSIAFVSRVSQAMDLQVLLATGAIHKSSWDIQFPRVGSGRRIANVGDL